MFKAFVAVVVELWQFVTRSKSPQLLLEAGSVDTASVLSPQQIVAVCVPVTPLLKQPRYEFDECIRRLPYGETVIVMQQTAQFVAVQHQGLMGYVAREALCEPGQVVATFQSGVVYGPDHPLTKRIRLRLDDACLGDQLRLPLQATEYILFELDQHSIKLMWGTERPRLPGSWQKLLRGKPGVHIGITPRSRSVMEWTAEDGSGRLGFVTSVTPDGTITLCTVGQKQSGVYQCESRLADDWKELRPVFIHCV